jgi:hypothetical protein
VSEACGGIGEDLDAGGDMKEWSRRRIAWCRERRRRLRRERRQRRQSRKRRERRDARGDLNASAGDVSLDVLVHNDISLHFLVHDMVGGRRAVL